MIDSYDSEFLVQFLVVAALVVVVPLVMCGPLSCPNNRQAEEVLRAQGYSEIRATGGAGVARCGRDETSATGFTARAPSGARVRGVVCCGVLVGACSVRVSEVLDASRR